MTKFNILGSCISRIIMLNGEPHLHGIYGDDMQLGYFLDKQNIALAMLPAPFPQAELDAIDESCLYEKSRIHSLRQCLDKSTVNLLLASDAEYLIMDLYDFQNDFMVYGDTAFSTCAHEFLNTELFRRHKEQLRVGNFMQMPTLDWYGYVDMFFGQVMQKYDADHIILNRFRSNRYYQGKDGRIHQIPDSFKQPYHSNDKYNGQLGELEEYIIAKYQPYVIDLSKYYICDENMWSNLNGAHFEKEFYQDAYEIVCNIVKEHPDRKYWDTPSYLEKGLRFEEMRSKGYAFDVEQALQLLPLLVEADDSLWMNLLAKLHTYAPEDERVQAYVHACLSEG